MSTVTATTSQTAREAWGLLFRLAKEKHQAFTAALQEHDLTPVLGHALRLLDPERPLPMSDLADALYCHASNVTGIVDRLELRGLVERRPDPQDRRVKTLVLTAAGRDVRGRVVQLMNEPPAAIATLPVSDQRALRDILRRAAGG